MRIITSSRNDLVKSWKLLAQKPLRESEDSLLFLTEGEHMTLEAVAAEKAITLIVQNDKQERYSATTAHFSEDNTYLVTAEVMCQICDTRTPQGIACICRMSIASSNESSKYVALEGVQDPGNVGTIIRTMDAAGFENLIIDRNCANPFGPKAARASMGAIFRVKISIVDDLAAHLRDLSSKGIDILAGDLNGSNLFCADYNPKSVCILIGNEGAGLSEQIKANANIRVKIPMPGRAESLNAGIACAVMIYDSLRRESDL